MKEFVWSVMSWLDTVGHDLRYGCRLIRKSPLLSIATILTLALGIGLDAGVFVLVDGMVFRARVNEDPDSFVQVSPEYSGPSAPPAAGLPFISLDDYRAYRGNNTSLRDLAAWAPVHAALGRPGGDEGTDTIPMLVTCNFFAVYDRMPPLRGRVLRPDECEAPGRAPVAVIGEDLWRSRFAADPDIVGATMTLNREPFVVVGVMPAGYAGQLRGPIWVPYTMQSVFHVRRDLFREPATPWLVAVGRLAPGSSRASALADLSVIATQQDRLTPGRQTKMRLTNGSLIEEPMVRTMAVWIVPLIMGALSLVLLIACANVTVLLLSRATARQHEMAVRVSLGASRWRLLRMMLIESLILAAIAGPLSVYLAYEVPIVFRKSVARMPFYPFTFDRVVFAYLAGLSLFAGLTAGLAPALESLRSNVSASLHGQEYVFGGERKWRIRDVLVAAQVAMSLVLLAGAGLFVRAAWRLATADPGYEMDHVLVVTPRIGVPPYSPESAVSLYRAVADRARVIPGVRFVAHASAPPLSGSEDGGGGGVITLPGQAPDRGRTTATNTVSPEFFDALGIPIVRGRVFRDTEATGRIPPVVVSESLAREMWPDRGAIGELASVNGREVQVAGVARDIAPMTRNASASWIVYGLRTAQAFGGAMLVRFDGDARSVAGALRSTIAALDRGAATEPQTLTMLRDTLAERFMRIVTIVAFLALVALVLALIGIYGVVAFSVNRRVREMGIRMALGATKTDIIRMILSSGTRPMAAGLAIGLVVALVASQALMQIFRNAPAPPVTIDARDPIPYASVAVLLAITAVAAMFGPALRAASADPVNALRQD